LRRPIPDGWFLKDSTPEDRGQREALGLVHVSLALHAHHVDVRDGVLIVAAIGDYPSGELAGVRPVIGREVAGQGATQVPFAKDDDMIQTLAPDRADEPLREGFCHGLWGAVRISSIPMPRTL
jgi:hypothetical protein